MSFRFLHTGDLHLDSPFVGLSTEAPESVLAALRESTLNSWAVIVELALSEHVDFFLVAGDAFENANRTLRGQLRFRDGLAKLAVAGIPSFAVQVALGLPRVRRQTMRSTTKWVPIEIRWFATEGAGST